MDEAGASERLAAARASAAAAKAREIAAHERAIDFHEASARWFTEVAHDPRGAERERQRAQSSRDQLRRAIAERDA